MFIDNETKLRVNIHGPYKGFSKLDTPEIRERAAVVEIPDPVRGDEEYNYNQEINEAPYLIVTPKSQEQLDMQHNAKVKQQIAAIEAGQARAVREAALGDTTHIAAINASIEVLRATLLPEPPREG